MSEYTVLLYKKFFVFLRLRLVGELWFGRCW